MNNGSIVQKLLRGVQAPHIVLLRCRPVLACTIYPRPLRSIRAYNMSASAPEAVTFGDKKYRPIREGLASILAPYRESGPAASTTSKKPKNNDEGDQAVFYNPVQQFNRDLSVLAILVYGEGAVIQKQEKYKQKTGSLKRKREKAKKKKSDAFAQNAAQATPDGNQPNKRKLDDIDAEEAGTALKESDPKRLKLDELEVDGEELEVMELEGENTTALLNTPEDVLSRDRLGRSSDKAIGSVGPTDDSSTNAEPAATKILYPKRKGTSFTILDALSATGLRALRYAKEIPFATNIIANDLSSEAVKSIELNIDHNCVGEIVHSNVDDARAYMYSKVGNEHQSPSGKYVHRFDVIDLDPYGTAAPFLDSALQALQDGGLLCVTCTDAGVFASNGYPEKAYALYGGLPLKGAHSHEGGLRLILQAITTTAAKYGIAIEPMLSLSIDFYARVFVRVHKAPKDVKLLAGTSMLVYSCDQGCGAWTTQPMAKNQSKEDKNGDSFFKHGFAQAPTVTPNCEHCGFKLHLGGPMWAGPLHNSHFVQRMIDKLPHLDKDVYATTARLQGMLTVALQEDLTLPVSDTTAPSTFTTQDSNPAPESAQAPILSAHSPLLIPRLLPNTIDPSPFFFIPNYLAKVIHCTTPSEDQLRGAIRHLGYRVTRSHCKPGSFRTTAPWSVIWEVFREWVRTEMPIKDGAVKEGTAGWEILGGMRQTERKQTRDVKGDLITKLEKVEGLDEVRTILESTLFRLQKSSTSTYETAVNGEKAQASDEFSALGPNGNESPNPARRKRSLSPQPTSKLKVVFDERLGKEKDRGKLVRYQINPRANWGPMNRAGGNGA